jgi:hypothetical protein
MRRSDVWGWVLFVVCALVFVWASIRDRDPLMTLGSLLFLVACFFFLAPGFPARPGHHRRSPAEPPADANGPGERTEHRNEEPV